MGTQRTQTTPWPLSWLFGLGVCILFFFAHEQHRMFSPMQTGKPPTATDPMAAQAAAPNRSSSEKEERPPAFGQRIKERRMMVDSQIKLRGVKDPNVLNAMRTVPRHAFVLPQYQSQAYADRPLPIEHNQTISQPYIVAFMTEALALDPNDRVLEIGTGSGYQAAVCAEIAREVFTIEIVEPLAESAAKRLKELSYENIHVKAGDGFFGWPDEGPFDAIIGTAAAGRIPPPLLEQLKPDGNMILPVENDQGFQYLILIKKDPDGTIRKKTVLPVRFVPMTGKVDE